MRPPLALARLTESARGQVVFELPHLRADGATHLLLDPLELIEKLTLLIPPPRFHTLRFHGVLAPHAAWRSAVIPGRPEAEQPLTCLDDIKMIGNAFKVVNDFAYRWNCFV